MFPLTVALLAEGVDRNKTVATRLMPEEVALLAEGVDRNFAIIYVVAPDSRRPPRGGRG